MDTTLSPTAASIQFAKPGYVYGTPTFLPLKANTAQAMVRVGMPADIPSNATVSSAFFVMNQAGDMTGANTVLLKRHVAGWSMSKAAWNTAPAASATVSATVTKTGSPSLDQWSWDVTADVQAFVSGTLPNYGWRISTTSTTLLKFRGSTASSLAPQLVITYLTPGDPPDALTPDGNSAVSIAKPTLQFQMPPDATSFNVQIDADALTTIDFDSGEIVAAAGEFNLTTSAYAGLAAGASTFWRARSKDPLGWTDWSPWAQFQRVAKPTVTISSPGATADDSTPPIIWSATGQSSWRVIVRDAVGVVVADSGRIIGTDTTWTPPAAVAVEGKSASVEVRVWDAVDRIATPGDPVYAVATQTFTLQGTGSVSGATTLVATSDGQSPAVVLTGTRATAPDLWRVVRDGERLFTSDGPSSVFTYTDWTADPSHPHTYRLAPVVTGTGTSDLGPTRTISPTCRGIWLIDPDDPDIRAVIWGVDGGTWDATELAIIHQPIAGAPIRRVAYRPPLSGSISGDLVDVGDMTADAQITALYAFKADDRELRLVLGDRNMLVRVGDITVSPTPDSGRHSMVSFTWWQQGLTPWSP